MRTLVDAAEVDHYHLHWQESLEKSLQAIEVAWTCCDYGDALLQHNRPGDREQANALLTEALSLSRELGMRPLMERVLSRREIFESLKETTFWLTHAEAALAEAEPHP
jgi:hypothetical protein